MAPYQSTLRGAGAGGEGVNNRGQMDPSNYHDAIQNTIVRIMEDIQVAPNSEVTQAASAGPGTVEEANMAIPPSEDYFNVNPNTDFHGGLEPGNNPINDFHADIEPGNNFHSAGHANLEPGNSPINDFHADLEPGNHLHSAGPLLVPTMQPLAAISTCNKVLRNGIICGQPA